jgi:hypothetical protein
MPVYFEFQKTSSERSIFINANQIVMVSYGSSNDTTTIELAGQRTFEVRGSVNDTMLKLNDVSNERATR